MARQLNQEAKGHSLKPGRWAGRKGVVPSGSSLGPRPPSQLLHHLREKPWLASLCCLYSTFILLSNSTFSALSLEHKLGAHF